MSCPSCGSINERVLESRPTNNDTRVRRRICKACGHRWATLEMPVPDDRVYWSTKGTETTSVALYPSFIREMISHSYKIAPKYY